MSGKVENLPPQEEGKILIVSLAVALFPSPCGEMIGKVAHRAELAIDLLFPSPCGEMIGKAVAVFGLSKRMTKFPSPCGEMIGKVNDAFLEKVQTSEVSIPLRGNDRKRQEQIASLPGDHPFPSPCGEMIGKVDDKKCFGVVFASIVSIPLRGNDRKRLHATAFVV